MEKVKNVSVGEVKKLASLVDDSIYNYSKAKICNLLELSLPLDKVLPAKQVLEDIISYLALTTRVTILETLLEDKA